MSGHSKWSTIKRKKESKDAKRSKIFGQLSREITIAARSANSTDPDHNARLRLALQNAKHANLPKAVIEKALQKANQDTQSDNYQQLTYEGYGPAGVAIYVEAASDNTNRTLSNVRYLFNKHGGRLGNKGSLGFIFQPKGVFWLSVSDIEAHEAWILALIDAGAEHIANAPTDEEDNESLIVCPLQAFGNIQTCIETHAMPLTRAEVIQSPQHWEKIEPEEQNQVLRLVFALEEDADVQRVFHNMTPKEDTHS